MGTSATVVAAVVVVAVLVVTVNQPQAVAGTSQKNDWQPLLRHQCRPPVDL
jgi:hypothetical protein